MNDAHCALFVSDCHVRAGVELVSHRWDAVVVSALRPGAVRRSLLLERIAGISDKALTESLRRLLARGLVTRRSDGTRRVGADYELTELGESFANGPLMQLAVWAMDNSPDLDTGSMRATG